MASVRPVNRVLGFGIRGMTPVILLPWMLTCERSNAVSLVEDTFSKYYTHSISFNECAVVSDKVVSARKEARSAHVEISKMDAQDEGRKKRTAPKPQSRHEVMACLCLFLQKRKHMPRLFRLSSSPVFSKSSSSLSFLGRLLSLARGLRLSSVLILYGICRAH